MTKRHTLWWKKLT